MASGTNGNTPLHVAADLGHQPIVRDLLASQEYEVNCTNSIGETPLHLACYGGRIGTVRTLLCQFGADVNSRDSENDTPLNDAALGGHTDVVRALITQFGCSPQVRGFKGRSLLHQACGGGHLELVRTLVSEFAADLNSKDSDNGTPLIQAGLGGHTDVVLALITEFGCKPQVRGFEGRTLLHMACSKGHLSLIQVLLSGFLLYLHCTDERGDTPLHLASYFGHVSVVRMLLSEFGADVNSRNSQHATPLNSAALGGHSDVVCALITEFGCSPQMRGFQGRTLLHQACYGGHLKLVEKLVSKFECDPMAVSDTGDTPLHIAATAGHRKIVRELITRYKCPVNCRNKKHNTPLNEATLGGHTDVVRTLITEFGCSPQVRGFEGRTLLHQACYKGHLSLVEVLLSEFGLSVLSTDKDGDTPLHIASVFSQTNTVEKLLFEHNAPPFVRNRAGKSPVDFTVGGKVAKHFKKYIRSSRIQAEYEKLQSLAKRKFSGKHALTRIFVVGYPQAGKSSLIEALKRRGLFYSIFARTARLSEADVPPHTAGIVPSVFTGSQYGRVVFYDFAGDPEYYSSHAAVLESLVSPGCNLFFTVVDLSEEREVMTQKLGYWLSFISYHSKGTGVMSKVVVVGSHVDVVKSLGQDPREKMNHLELIAEKFCKQTHYMQVDHSLSLHCCKPTTTSMSKLRGLLKNTYLENPKHFLSLGASILLGLLERDFSSVTACQISTLLNHVQQIGMDHLGNMQQLYPIVKELHNLGLLIAVGSASDPRDHWLLLNVSALTEKVHELLFAEGSPVSQSLVDSPHSTLGIIPESVLTKILPKYITKECLKQLQYCQELKHLEIGSHHSIVPAVESSSDFEPLLFFPALLQNERGVSSLAIPQGQRVCNRGWHMKCTGEFDYFPPRFLHVLLLRLAFSFALRPFKPSLPSEQSGDQPSESSSVATDIRRCSRRCDMWRSGIRWLMEEGVECMVEVVKEREVHKGVVVVARSEEDCDVECASVFATVVQKVMEAKTEFCHSITPETYLIDPDELNQYPLPNVSQLHLYAMHEVERVLVEGKKRAVSVDGNKFVVPEKLGSCRYWSKYGNVYKVQLTQLTVK